MQAIAKAELDKLDPQTEVGRYLLGVRERNIRVVYLRPYAHLWEKRSIEATNVEIVRRIAQGLKARGYTLGTATPVPAFRVNPAIIAIASLAVPAVVLLILSLFGIGGMPLAVGLCVLDIAIVAAGYLVHHDMAARKLLALTGAIAFPVAAAIAIAPAFRSAIPGNPYAAGLRTLLIGVGTALAGGLIVVGLLSTPLMMEEIDRFTGVKAVLVVPPLLILGLYWFTPLFGGRLKDPRAALESPVRIIQLAVLAVLGLAAVLLVMRSGNTSDITPSSFELALRSNLTSILSVRPRFKEFVVGWPFLMLLPVSIESDRRTWGWLFALAIGVGLSDVVDTFSHLHTPLSVFGNPRGSRRRRRRRHRHDRDRRLPAVSPLRLLFSGYYGFGNLGDEALLEITVGELRRRHPDIEIDVLSHDPPATSARFGVEATPRMDIGAVKRAIDRADVLVSGGGGLLQNSTSTRSLLYYAGIIRGRSPRGSPP